MPFGANERARLVLAVEPSAEPLEAVVHGLGSPDWVGTLAVTAATKGWEPGPVTVTVVGGQPLVAGWSAPALVQWDGTVLRLRGQGRFTAPG